jgi:hypothetical protein
VSASTRPFSRWRVRNAYSGNRAPGAGALAAIMLPSWGAGALQGLCIPATADVAARVRHPRPFSRWRVRDACGGSGAPGPAAPAATVPPAPDEAWRQRPPGSNPAMAPERASTEPSPGSHVNIGNPGFGDPGCNRAPFWGATCWSQHETTTKVIAKVTPAMPESVNGIAGGFHDPGVFCDLQSRLIL